MKKDTKAQPGVWVLTRSHNDYDQHGEYFEAVFATKPTLQQLAEYFSVAGGHGVGTGNVMDTVAFLEHVRNGGGRRDAEYVWYDLEFVEFK